ncbi:FtsK/SpoIIIE domain-containing protein [Mycobacterium sp. PSTR-4-N]|uniref:FtsK/SpoIIIE domain-containing protein n=1 Tax=Mycobacterium sp. PSTR-4-N TaxID=2917745 RepID=UPI001F14AF8A|nr:FtsK/SpoIIIE domain-containing protein [Mycobacterium sp. PSTR-4-N]MCG7592735.1 cell division protein FtsK [Mycobacterium sp. PSTR-4-N]
MHLKVILRRDDGTQAQVAVTTDATATVADVAAALALGDPDRRSPRPTGNPTLKLEHAAFDTGKPGRVLEPSRSLLDSGVRSGATVSIVAAAVTPKQRRRGRSVAVVRVLDGPDAGREFSLPAGNSTIGTRPTCDVLLSDPGVKDVHAAVAVGETVEIANLAGPDGVLLGGRPVQRVAVGSNDVVVLSRTSLAILHTVRPGAVQTDSVAIEFNRSPRVVARFGERVYPAPKPPALPEPAHFPIVSMVLPLVMGLVLFAITRSLLAVAFIALSPLLMIGMYIDARYQSKKKHAADVERFADAQRALAAELTSSQQVERAVRIGETPALEEVVDSIHRLGPLLWTHRPDSPEFLTLRVGLGDAPSRCRVEMPSDNEADPKYLAQLSELRDEFAVVRDVPLVADLRECGALGVCGPRAVADGVARGLVLQLIGLHSPSEVVITAFASQHSRVSWEWLEWLPHTSSAHSPLSGNHLTDSENGGVALLSRLEDLVKQRDGRQSLDTEQEPIVPAVVALVDDTAPIDRSRLTRLAERGPRVGVYIMWVAAQVSSLPAACRTFVLVENESTGSTIGEVRHGRHIFPVACDSIEVADAKQIALLLAPVVDVGAATDDASDLPRSVSYLSLSGDALATDPGAVGRLWLSNNSVIVRDGRRPSPTGKPSGLPALVGSTGAQPFSLDLREHGPHALVGGTTGAGKSEFLQSWILGMATAHSPDRVNFLLVDYKGGTAFADCAELPHTVGLVTDLSPHLVRRALTSLGAEIKTREELLNSKRAKDLISLEQTGDPDTPPSLVIIVDEFAALATEIPEFVDGVIDVAQRGRSLGLHLILATQRPAGVIKDNLRANTNLRIALRLNDVDDSLDVIDDPLAAHFPPEIPGRAVAKTGPGRLTTFQSGYVGGRSDNQSDSATIDVWEFVFGRRRPWSTLSATVAHRSTGPTDIARMVGTVRAASTQLGLRAPRRPWLEPLNAVYALENLSDHMQTAQLVIGRGDIPEHQVQPTVTYSPDEGNMAIIGTSGSGKSTALCTIAAAAALAEDGPTHVYVLDFASGSMQILEPLPQVAAVVGGDDDERVGRVLRRLSAILDQRAQRFARVNASTLAEYRQSTHRNEPRILLMVDGIAAFRDTYEHVGYSTNYAMFAQLAADGRRLGVHVVVTGDRPGALSTSLNAMMQQRLTLRLASDDDYMLSAVPNDVLSVNSPPGRGIMVGRGSKKGHEVQVAVLGGDDTMSAQAAAIRRLAEKISAAGFPAPDPVERLADRIPLAELPVTGGAGETVIGVADESLRPLGIDPRGVLMVTGPPGSGRTTALLTLVQAVRRTAPDTMIVNLAPASSSVTGLDVWSETAVGTSDVLALAGRLASSVQFGSAKVMVVIESLADFGNGEAESELVRLVKTVSEGSGFVVGESEVSTWGQAWLLAQPFKSARRGLLLAPSGVEADSLLGTPLGTIRRHDFPPGRGVLIEKGKGVWLQVAQPVI